MTFLNNDKRILFIEACNYVNAPLGGQLTMARMLLRALGSQLALAGWTDDAATPIGKWHKRVIDNVEYDFFATAYVPANKSSRPLIPARLLNWFLFKKYGKEILSCGITNILTREHIVMMAMPFTSAHNVCFWFPGVYSALSASRYKWAKFFSFPFDAILNRKLRRYARKILAAADDEAIASLRRRAGGILDKSDICFFPTRVDTLLFHANDPVSARKELSLPSDALFVVTSGRLQRVKGWPLLLKAFKYFSTQHAKAILIFVGDGIDRKKIETAVSKLGLEKCVTLVGAQSPAKLALFLQAAICLLWVRKRKAGARHWWRR